MDRREIAHHVPLSQIQYENTGITIPWMEVRLFIPYSQMHVEPVPACMLEELSGHFRANLDLLLNLDPDTGTIASIKIQPGSSGLKELDQAAECMRLFTDEVRSKIKNRTLTFRRAKKILANLNYRLPDDCLNRLLERVTAQLPPEGRLERFSLPLSGLTYADGYISFARGRTRYRVATDRLGGFVPYSAFNAIRDQITGEMVFTRRVDSLVRWDASNARLAVGQLGAEMTGGQARLADPDAFHRIRVDQVCAAFNASVEKTIERLEHLLAEWGLSPADEMTGKSITGGIPAFETTETIPMLLKDIGYGDKNVTILIRGVKKQIENNALGFKVLPAFNRIKRLFAIFERGIEFQVRTRTVFRWTKMEPYYRSQIKIEEIQTHIDDETREQLERIYTLHSFALSRPTQEETREKPPAGHKPSVVSKPSKPLVVYENKCVKTLEKMSKAIYLQSGDGNIHFWFHIQKKNEYLVWEVPVPNKATYIFGWDAEFAQRMGALVNQIEKLNSETLDLVFAQSRTLPSAASINIDDPQLLDAILLLREFANVSDVVGVRAIKTLKAHRDLNPVEAFTNLVLRLPRARILGNDRLGFKVRVYHNPQQVSEWEADLRKYLN